VVYGVQAGASSVAGGYHAHYWADVNGDGKADLVYLAAGTSTWHVQLSTGTGLGPDRAWGSSNQPIKWDTADGPRVVDVNGDGRADLVYYQADTGATWHLLLSTGTAFAADTVWAITTLGIDSYGGVHQFFLIDVDGDHKLDLIYLQNPTTTWRAALSTTSDGIELGPDSVYGAQTNNTATSNGHRIHYWTDLNGDGRPDLVYLEDGTTTFRAALAV